MPWASPISRIESDASVPRPVSVQHTVFRMRSSLASVRTMIRWCGVCQYWRVHSAGLWQYRTLHRRGHSRCGHAKVKLTAVKLTAEVDPKSVKRDSIPRRSRRALRGAVIRRRHSTRRIAPYRASVQRIP
eukprot:12386-Rhodomonas_salina.2